MYKTSLPTAIHMQACVDFGTISALLHSAAQNHYKGDQYGGNRLQLVDDFYIRELKAWIESYVQKSELTTFEERQELMNLLHSKIL
jgi:hypothetical protein